MNKQAKSIFIGGTSSDAGKSLLVTGLLSLALSKGVRAAPFKSQNMSLNSYVTSSGEEMGVAQAVQARAAGLDPDFRMNPILLKPLGDNKSEVIVNGHSRGVKTTQEYYSMKKELFEISKSAYNELANQYDLIIMEGAGSVAEINLWKNDIVNMPMAEFADAEVYLVSDIDRGGSFASLFGTYQLFPPHWQKRVCGYFLNKFRGDEALLTEGVHELSTKMNVPCMGIVPYVKGLNIPREDSLSVHWNESAISSNSSVNLGIIKLPHASLVTDFEPFLNDPDVTIEFVVNPSELHKYDALFIPGSKNSITDLVWLKESGLAQKILEFQGVVVGICGGMQLMGESLTDPIGLEQPSPATEKGLSLLPLKTVYKQKKTTHRVADKDPFFGKTVEGFEIHYGETEPPALFYGNPDCLGTYLHGVFDKDDFRNALLSHIYKKKTGHQKKFTGQYTLQSSIDTFTEVLKKHTEWAGVLHQRK